METLLGWSGSCKMFTLCVECRQWKCAGSKTSLKKQIYTINKNEEEEKTEVYLLNNRRCTTKWADGVFFAVFSFVYYVCLALDFIRQSLVSHCVQKARILSLSFCICHSYSVFRRMVRMLKAIFVHFEFRVMIFGLDFQRSVHVCAFLFIPFRKLCSLLLYYELLLDNFFLSFFF